MLVTQIHIPGPSYSVTEKEQKKRSGKIKFCLNYETFFIDFLALNQVGVVVKKLQETDYMNARKLSERKTFNLELIDRIAYFILGFHQSCDQN